MPDASALDFDRRLPCQIAVITFTQPRVTDDGNGTIAEGDLGGAPRSDEIRAEHRREVLVTATQAEHPGLLLASDREVDIEPARGEARFEATRCLSCGNCYECDNCLAACPEQAIVKLGKGRFYRVDLDLCTGCAACFEQCPCHAIEMVHEPRAEGAVAHNATERVPARFTVRV